MRQPISLSQPCRTLLSVARGQKRKDAEVVAVSQLVKQRAVRAVVQRRVACLAKPARRAAQERVVKGHVGGAQQVAPVALGSVPQL